MATWSSARWRWRWQAVAGEVKRQVQDKYKQARLALGDVTAAELLVQEATSSNDSNSKEKEKLVVVEPDARTLACIADAAFDMDEWWRIAGVLHQRLQGDWKEWRPVYKALVVLEFLLTHGPGPDELDLAVAGFDYLPALRDLRSFNYTDDRGFNWGACMQRRAEAILLLLTDADHARRSVHHHGQYQYSPTSGSSSSPSSATSSASGTWSFGSDSPGTLVCLDYPLHRHDKKLDAYTADDDHVDPARGWEWDEDASLLPQPEPRCCYSSRASGFQSLSQPERRRKPQLQR